MSSLIFAVKNMKNHRFKFTGFRQFWKPRKSAEMLRCFRSLISLSTLSTDYSKLYIPSSIKTQMNLVLLLSLGRLGRLAVLKISAILLKYPTYEDVF